MTEQASRLEATLKKQSSTAGVKAVPKNKNKKQGGSAQGVKDVQEEPSDNDKAASVKEVAEEEKDEGEHQHESMLDRMLKKRDKIRAANDAKSRELTKEEQKHESMQQ